MRGIAVLQARTSSSRLPAKVLLPIAGVPLAVLAAQRAANLGRRVMVATSVDASDDVLTATLREHGLEVFRGSLTDVLGRIVGAIDGCPDDTPIIRLTADNVVPGGDLLNDLEEEFRQRRLGYLSCNNVGSGLPYGASAEITFAGELRAAADAATSAHDREHVTPWIIRSKGMASFERHRALAMGHYRCTVDSLDDYLAVQRLFRGVSDASTISTLDLVDRLRTEPDCPIVPRAASRLVLGTAQLGLPYGIANVSGRPPAGEARDVIRTAIRNGVTYIDTARAYGVSERVVGNALAGGWSGRATVISKLSPLDECPADAADEVVKTYVDASVFRSCRELGVDRLHVLMLHRASHRTDWNGAAWRRLQSLREEGVVETLGVSVQSPLEALSVLDDPLVGYLQLPFNLLDWRWDDMVPAIEEARTRRGLIVHARSLFLQGLLLSDQARHWQQANLADATFVRTWLLQQVAGNGRDSRSVLCLAYGQAQPWVAGVVVGMESLGQLLANLRDFARPALRADQVTEIVRTRPVLEEATLNPACWGKP